MIITKTSPVTGQTLTRELPITREQYTAWQTGTLIQDAMPELPEDDREWLISGCTPEDWCSLWRTPSPDAVIPF